MKLYERTEPGIYFRRIIRGEWKAFDERVQIMLFVFNVKQLISERQAVINCAPKNWFPIK